MTPKLILMDLDGTISEYKTGKLLPNVKNTIDALPAGTQLGICSNQGGAGLRYWMESEGWGNWNAYPTEQDVRVLVKKVLEELNIIIPVYFCFAYQSKKSGKWNPEPMEEETQDMNCWRRDWRKPEAGMLLQAMQDAGVSAEETLFVGDWGEDQLAAAKAECSFQWDYEFFKRERVQTE